MPGRAQIEFRAIRRARRGQLTITTSGARIRIRRNQGARADALARRQCHPSRPRVTKAARWGTVHNPRPRRLCFSTTEQRKGYAEAYRAQVMKPKHVLRFSLADLRRMGPRGETRTRPAGRWLSQAGDTRSTKASRPTPTNSIRGAPIDRWICKNSLWRPAGSAN